MRLAPIIIYKAITVKIESQTETNHDLIVY